MLTKIRKIRKDIDLRMANKALGVMAFLWLICFGDLSISLAAIQNYVPNMAQGQSYFHDQIGHGAAVWEVRNDSAAWLIQKETISSKPERDSSGVNRALETPVKIPGTILTREITVIAKNHTLMFSAVLNL